MDLTSLQGLNILDSTLEGELASGDTPTTAPEADASPATPPVAQDGNTAPDSAPAATNPTMTPEKDTSVPEVDKETLTKASSAVAYNYRKIKNDFKEVSRENAELKEAAANVPDLVAENNQLKNQLENAELAAQFGCDPKMLAQFNGSRSEKEAWLNKYTMPQESHTAPAPIPSQSVTEQPAEPVAQPTESASVNEISTTDIPNVDTNRPAPVDAEGELAGMTPKEKAVYWSKRL